MDGELVDTIEESDIVVFTGGEDVSPELYEEFRHPKTSSNSRRDKEETIEFTKARSLNKKLIGICRGSQFLCVMAGGRLVQDQLNPLHIHPIETIGGDIFEITSSHHQAQYPYLLKPDEEYKLLAWTKGISRFHKNGRNEEIDLPENKEAEIVFYPKINALGIQGHPEWMNKKVYPKTFEKLDDLLDNFLAEKL